MDGSIRAAVLGQKQINSIEKSSNTVYFANSEFIAEKISYPFLHNTGHQLSSKTPLLDCFGYVFT